MSVPDGLRVSQGERCVLGAQRRPNLPEKNVHPFLLGGFSQGLLPGATPHSQVSQKRSVVMNEILVLQSPFDGGSPSVATKWNS